MTEGVSETKGNEVTKPRQLDGFERFETAVEGNQDEASSPRVVQGVLLKFTNEATWVTPDGEEFPGDLELVAVDVGRVVQKWINQLPAETILLDPEEKWPDVDKLNADAPRSEWAAHRHPRRAGKPDALRCRDAGARRQRGGACSRAAARAGQ
jgi:hypothetical protein